jgi:hypothetical protein
VVKAAGTVKIVVAMVFFDDTVVEMPRQLLHTRENYRLDNTPDNISESLPLFQKILHGAVDETLLLHQSTMMTFVGTANPVYNLP